MSIKTYSGIDTKKMLNAGKKIAAKVSVPQTAPIPGREKEMVKNAAGGFSFKSNAWEILNRFLILGTEGGSYYVGEKKLTEINTDNLKACIANDGIRVINVICEISTSGRSHKRDQLLLALAMCAKLGNLETKIAANKEVVNICKTGTDILHYTHFVNMLGGWGSGSKRSIARWYTDKTPGNLGYQVAKYQSRDGFSHRDVLRLVHAKVNDEAVNNVLGWAANKIEYNGSNWVKSKEIVDIEMPPTIEGFELAKCAKSAGKVIEIIKNYNLPRECIPTEYLKNPDVFMALLQHMPPTATIRNLGKMSSIGILDQRSEGEKIVIKRLTDPNILKIGKLHPVAILLALDTYSSGHGDKGSLTWVPNARIVDALNEAFYLSFQTLDKTDKSYCLGVDVSGSMTSKFMGTSITSCKAAAAMAMVIANSTNDYYVGGFSQKFVPLNITPKMRLDQVMKICQDRNFGGTDASIPIMDAMSKNQKFDAFVTLSDGESWAGSIHAATALEKYRARINPDAKLVCINFVANSYSIADPKDMGSINLVGFDPTIPVVMKDFVEGKI